MQRLMIENIPLDFTEAELFRLLKMPDDADKEDRSAVLAMARECFALANPKAVYGVAAVQEKLENAVVVEGKTIASPLVRKNLEKARRIIPFVATCGVEAEEWSAQYTDFLEAYWADGIKMLLLHKIRTALTERVKKDYFASSDMSAMSPGSLPAWPLPAQEVLFDLIGDVEKLTGVTLTDSFLMLPSKSCSGFFFSAESHYENCALCPILDCPGRRAKYEGEPKTI